MFKTNEISRNDSHIVATVIATLCVTAMWALAAEWLHSGILIVPLTAVASASAPLLGAALTRAAAHVIDTFGEGAVFSKVALAFLALVMGVAVACALRGALVSGMTQWLTVNGLPTVKVTEWTKLLATACDFLFVLGIGFGVVVDVIRRR